MGRWSMEEVQGSDTILCALRDEHTSLHICQNLDTEHQGEPTWGLGDAELSQ